MSSSLRVFHHGKNDGVYFKSGRNIAELGTPGYPGPSKLTVKKSHE